MTLQELLTELSQRGVQLSADGDKLRIRAPQGTITSELRNALAEYKMTLLVRLQEREILHAGSDIPLEPVPREANLPLSFSQERLWFFEQLEGPTAAYTIPAALHFRGPLQIHVLEDCFNELVRRHEILRTTFLMEKGYPVQVIAPEANLTIPVKDIRQIPEKKRWEEMQRVATEEAQHPFDLENGPLLRVTLLQVAKEDYVLLLNMHHIISDGWSLYVLTFEIATLYKAYITDQPSPLHELSVQYGDFAVWERKWLQGERLEKQLMYWKKYLSDVPTVLELPIDHPRLRIPSYRGSERRAQFSKALVEQLKMLSRKEDVTLFMTLYTVFQTLIYKYSQQSDFVIAISDANRNQPEVEPLIGFFINQFLLRANFQEDVSFRQMLHQVRKDTLGAYKHKLLPFSRLVQELQPERDSRRNPLFQILFILHNTPKPVLEFDEQLEVQPLDIHTGSSRLDSMISITEKEEGLLIQWEYSSDLFEDETIQLLLEAYQTLLEQAVQQPEQHISAFELPEQLQYKLVQIRQDQNILQTMRLHHLGFACHDIAKGIRHVEALYQVTHISDIVFDEFQRSKVCLIETDNGMNIELIAGKEVESLLQQGVILYQMCYEVSDIFQAIDTFLNQGAILVSEPKPAKLFDNRLVAFLNTELGLIELLEAVSSTDSAERAKNFAASQRSVQSQTIMIAATFTAEPVEEALHFWLQELDTPSHITFAPYNQVFQQLLDTSSVLYTNTNGINIVLIRFEDWLKEETFYEQLERNVNDLILALQTAAQRSSVPYLLCVCPASPDLIADPDRATVLQNLENRLVKELEPVGDLYVVTSIVLTTTYPVAFYYDLHANRLGHVPFTPTFFAALGTVLARTMYAMHQTPYKVIVLDCDGTLWRGVCGEDGAFGIQIDTPYTALQAFMIKLHEAGMLLCLCSKNSEEDVFEVLDYRPDMLLKREHIVAHRINWQTKSANLHSLADELQLDLDSFIFLDDNPIECAEVRSNCPQVLTLQLPSDVEMIPTFLHHIWAFDHLKVTQEDRQRTRLYQENTQREQFRKTSLTFSDFLDRLELDVRIETMSSDQLPRVSQLTQRTNQFNCTTIRRSENDIQALCDREGYECLVSEVNDRFGAYGLVGVIIFKTETNVLTVDTFLLSCRALGRGVEHQMLARLGELAQQRGLKSIAVPFFPTPKNQPALDFLKRIGTSKKESQDNGWLFRFPAEVAGAVEYRPKTSELPSTPDPGTSKAPPQAGTHENIGTRRIGAERALLLNRIATEFYDAGQIYNVMTVRKQQHRPDVTADFLAPRNAVEEELANIWTDVLGIDRVGMQDDFFQLGGHSLLATQIMSRINEIFHVNLPLRSLLDQPTIAYAAQRIETIQWAAKQHPQEASTLTDEDREEGEI